MNRLILEGLIVIILLGSGCAGMVIAGNQMYSQGYLNGHADGVHSGYKNGYTDGYAKGQIDQSQSDGSDYQNGYNAGQQSFSDFYDYLVNSCAKDYNGYYQVVVYKSSSDGTYHYTCIA